MNIEPLLRAFFAAANLIPYLRVKDFGAAARKRAEPGIAQNFHGLANWLFENALREMANLDCREGLDMQIRIERA